MIWQIITAETVETKEVGGKKEGEMIERVQKNRKVLADYTSVR